MEVVGYLRQRLICAGMGDEVGENLPSAVPIPVHLNSRFRCSTRPR